MNASGPYRRRPGYHRVPSGERTRGGTFHGPAAGNARRVVCLVPAGGGVSSGSPTVQDVRGCERRLVVGRGTGAGLPGTAQALRQSARLWQHLRDSRLPDDGGWGRIRRTQAARAAACVVPVTEL